MTIAAALYSFITAVAVAAAIDRLFAARQWPRRGVWLVALAMSVLIPAVLIYSAWRLTGTQQTLRGTSTAILSPAVFLLTSGWPILTAFNMLVGIAWGMSTALYLVLGFVIWVRLQILSRRWTYILVDDQEVLLSETDGPAAYGLLFPRIVIPRWLQDFDPAERAAITALQAILI